MRPFRRLWIVLGISSLGDWLGLLATTIFAAENVSGSTAKGVAFGSVIALRVLPGLILGSVAGVLADRFDRRYTMVTCDLFRFLLFASMPMMALVTDNPALVVGWAAIATFLIESVTMLWTPAKEAAVPNLLPKARLETANQLSLGMTYGAAPIMAGLLLAGLTTGLGAMFPSGLPGGLQATHVALYFNALTFLSTAITVLVGIKEISGRSADHAERKPKVLREFVTGLSFVSRTPMVRGLVLGILGAFAAGGTVIGTGNFYATSLGGGDSTFYILVAMLFLGMSTGIVAGPRLVGALSRRRWFGMSIVLAAGSIVGLALAWHLFLAVVFAVLVGVGAGMAFLSGMTLLGGEVDDEIRGRALAFVAIGIRVVLLLAIALSSFLVGAGGSHEVSLAVVAISISTTRMLLAVAGIFGAIIGIVAFQQMDDKPGVPVLADLIGSLRGRPLSAKGPHVHRGLFVVFEGGEGAGKSTQVRLLAETLSARDRDVVVTREPGATAIGRQIRSLLLDQDRARAGEEPLAPRAEALLYAADRAHHVAAVIRPALGQGQVVISDRYVDSSLAYQGAGRVLPVDEISWLSAWATGGLKPDLVVLLDIDPTLGLRRVRNRGAVDRLESETAAFHDRVRYAFLDLATDDPNRYLVLDASDTPEAVAELVLARVEALLPATVIPPGDGEAGAATVDLAVTRNSRSDDIKINNGSQINNRSGIG
ncbi:MAG: dTMP kinase [Micromonosporaceae bacterium]|nr:dTMP kinase [Micromonosporaceae bacterium]